MRTGEKHADVTEGHDTALASPEPLCARCDRPAGVPRPFRASRRQRAYVEAWLDPTMPKSVHGICQALGLPRSNVYYWRQQPAFVAWFERTLDAHTAHLWRPILIKVAQLALQGSVEHAKLLAQIRGAIRAPDDQAHRGGVTVVIGVPRPVSPSPAPTAPPATLMRDERTDARS